MLFHSSSLCHIVLTKGHVLPFSPMLLQIESDVTPFIGKVTGGPTIFLLKDNLWLGKENSGPPCYLPYTLSKTVTPCNVV